MRVVVAALVWVFVLGVGVSEEGDLASQCNVLVQKVLPCLSFATGQAAVPTKECCSATLEIKNSDPKCLCFAIQQTHKGIPEAKSMGIQEELLGLSPNSPDAAIFRNGTLRINSTSTLGTTRPVSDTHKASFGTMLPPPLAPPHLAALLCAILLLLTTLI
ncbi:non-specific lipid transfer protein GPI-anchored 1-like isoform X2 [Vigna unguiculata]|uniref:non-specific lipid transfer protein GPI-anchored 1-like isoform X2 n=1 Tax=Vigna unguiculata TaxID=3917 RepID=UPI001016BEC3|nr:non-specific lipid transfer protein GPI-anchored 1-like isoform X2 [Vigna unguiculata]